MSNILSLRGHDKNIEKLLLLEQHISRRRFLAFTVVGLGLAGCAPGSFTRATTGKRVTTPTLSSPQRRTLQPIRVDNATRVRSLFTLDSESGASLAVAWAPSGGLLAVGGADSTIQLWNVSTLKKQAPLHGHTAQVNRINWSPDGRLLATASSDGTVRLWDGQQYTPQAILQGTGEGNSALSIAWSPDSKRLVAGYGNGAVEIWDVTTHKGQTLLGQQATDLRTKAVWGIAWSPDGKWIISPQYDGILHVWEAESRKLLRILSSDDLPNDVLWTHDGRILASSSDKGTVQLWRSGVFNNIATLKSTSDNGWVYPLAWSLDGGLLAGGYETGLVQIWDVGTGKVLNAQLSHIGQVWDLAWSPGGMLIASASKDGTVRLWGTA